MWSST